MMELRQKGISQDIIDQVLTEETPDDVPDETEQLNRLVEQRIQKYHGMDRQQIYQKLGAYLGRRGFSWDLIRKSIDRHLEKEYN